MRPYEEDTGEIARKRSGEHKGGFLNHVFDVSCIPLLLYLTLSLYEELNLQGYLVIG